MPGSPPVGQLHRRRAHGLARSLCSNAPGWPHSVLDAQIVEAATMLNEPAAPVAVVKIRCPTDQGPAWNSPPWA
jgi:hypothetical protein